LPSAHYLAHTELDVTGGCSACLPMCRCLWILTIILALIQKKTVRHETISCLCPSAFVRNEVHNEFCQNIRCERRQKNEDGIWIHVSLFCPDQGRDLGQHSQTTRHESLICLHPWPWTQNAQDNVQDRQKLSSFICQVHVCISATSFSMTSFHMTSFIYWCEP
jgi:hypothetical protein